MILRPGIHDLIAALQREIEMLRAENAALRQEVADLRRQLDKTSSNSSSAPSSDGLRIRRGSRAACAARRARRAAASRAHAGGALEAGRQAGCPSSGMRHEARRHCLAGLKAAMIAGVEKRQVFDLPEPRLTGRRASGDDLPLRRLPRPRPQGLRTIIATPESRAGTASRPPPKIQPPSPTPSPDHHLGVTAGRKKKPKSPVSVG
jgi:Family of unknown function (DUF6444)